MINKFIFHGVGQGLFYFGSIDNGKFNFVYDCGTFDIIDDRKKIYEKVKENIIEGIYKNTKFDFIAISHLHADHINFLPVIIKNLKQDGKIFLPYFPKAKEYEYAFIAYLIFNGIEPDINDTDSNTSIFQYLYTFYIGRRGRNDIPNYNLVFIGENEEEDYPYHQESYLLENNFPLWYFKFYNKRLKDYRKLETLNDEIKNLLGSDTIEDYLKKDYYNGIKQIKAKFEIKKQDFIDETNINNQITNATSLLLLHHPAFGPATLLTGDIVFDLDLEKRINNGLSKNCEKLEILQIPHHGCKDNWDSISGKWKFKPSNLIISFGWYNSRKHPSSIFYKGIKSKIFKTNQINLVYYDYNESIPETDQEQSFAYQIENYWYPLVPLRFYDRWINRWIIRTID